MIKKLNLVVLFAFPLLWGCQTEVTESNAPIEVKTDTIIAENELQTEAITNELTSEIKQFKGNWFDIEYPANFMATPSKPIISEEEITYVETDEAYFESPDGEVEFFVYSPQWGGEPTHYFEVKPNEKISDNEEAIDEIIPTTIIKWVTIEDENGAYTRSYYHKKTESTDLVFGIKYKNQAIYDLYYEQYKAFKKSLVQYAD